MASHAGRADLATRAGTEKWKATFAKAANKHRWPRFDLSDSDSEPTGEWRADPPPPPPGTEVQQVSEALGVERLDKRLSPAPGALSGFDEMRMLHHCVFNMLASAATSTSK